jgi:hypothetical protein
MSVYVGMDVHRKRSQVAIVDEDGVQQRNRNLANDPAKLVPILGGLPPGTPVELEAAGQDGRTTRSTRPPWRSCCAPTCCRRPGSRPSRSVIYARCAPPGQPGAAVDFPEEPGACGVGGPRHR